MHAAQSRRPPGQKEAARDAADDGRSCAAPLSETGAEEITRLLHEARRGNRASADRLLEAVYTDLRGIARRSMAVERPDHTLQPTALVHEAYLRIFEGAPVDWQSRAHFFAVAASQMRRVLVDHGREFRAAKRGRGLKVALEDSRHAAPLPECDIEAVDELLDRLQRADAEAARVVELKFFSGLTDKEVAEAMQVSHSTVRRHWIFARAWLARQLTPKKSD
ncbi:MAG: sigma-70 family RNA polymerase sigma factor [Bryobacterales bacterium]|nr:sigma-70 family RNA polymerase sigma factor [Bryobacterales bacterium]MBV9400421.1 sigma-70 family RNA polymerase sigma factor [Bryobacterales bacterium]